MDMNIDFFLTVLYFVGFQFLAFLLICIASAAWSIRLYGQDQCIGLAFTGGVFMMIGIVFYCLILIIILTIFNDSEIFLISNRGILYTLTAICSGILSGFGHFLNTSNMLNLSLENEIQKTK